MKTKNIKTNSNSISITQQPHSEYSDYFKSRGVKLTDHRTMFYSVIIQHISDLVVGFTAQHCHNLH